MIKLNYLIVLMFEQKISDKNVSIRKLFDYGMNVHTGKNIYKYPAAL